MTDFGRDQRSGIGVFIARHKLLLVAGALLVAAAAIGRSGVDQGERSTHADTPIVFSGDASAPVDADAGDVDIYPPLPAGVPEDEEWCSTRPTEEDRFQASRGVEQCPDPGIGCARKEDIYSGC